MNEELKKRFTKQKIEDLLNDNVNPLPTIIAEIENPITLELIRIYCLFEGAMIPFQVKHHLSIVPERLDFQRSAINWGNLYILINLNWEMKQMANPLYCVITTRDNDHLDEAFTAEIKSFLIPEDYYQIAGYDTLAESI